MQELPSQVRIMQIGVYVHMHSAPGTYLHSGRESGYEDFDH